MSETRDAFAARLNGREYGSEMTTAEEAEAKAARLLVVFGASDDLTEFRGIIDDEAGASDRYGHRVARVGGIWTIIEPTEDMYGRRVEPEGVLIETKWCPETLETSWLIKPSVPFALFDIMEDDDLYCRGAVIDEADLLPAQRVLLVEPRIGHPDELIVSFSESLSRDDIASVHEYLKGWAR